MVHSTVTSSPRRHVWARTLDAWLLACLGVASWRLVTSFSHGLEGSDEGSYLLFIANPWASPGLGLFYGFLLHPWWELAGGNVTDFRLAGWTILGILVAGFAACLWRFLCRGLSGGWAVALFAFLLLGGFTHYTRGIRTPGYDWVVLAGALVFCAGWLWLESEKEGHGSVVGEAWLAAGIVVLAAGKWLVVPGYLLLLSLLLWARLPNGGAARVWLRLTGWLLIFGLLFAVYAGPAGLTDTWKAGLVYGRSADRDGIVLLYLGWLLGYAWVLLRALLWVAAMYALVWGILRLLFRRPPTVAAVGSVVFGLGLALALFRGHGQGGLQSWGKASMLTGTWLIGVLLLAQSVTGRPGNFRAAVSSPACRLLFLFSAAPLLNAAGTITGLTNYLAHGTVFWLAAGWVALSRALARGLPEYAPAAALLMMGTLLAARIATTPEDVMRVGRVWEADTLVQTGPEAGRLRLYAPSVRALSEIEEAMRREGYQPGDPVVGWVDLCALVYLLGGTSPGSSWYLGGISNHLQRVSPEVLQKTFVLFRQSVPEEPGVSWPHESGVPAPVLVPNNLAWPAGDGEGIPEPIRLYRPAISARDH